MKLFKKIIAIALIGLSVVSCNDTKKECEADCKKECCVEKSGNTCEPGCEKACCADKVAKTCEPGCEKACCAKKAE